MTNLRGSHPISAVRTAPGMAHQQHETAEQQRIREYREDRLITRFMRGEILPTGQRQQAHDLLNQDLEGHLRRQLQIFLVPDSVARD